jgi:iron complex outermembrane receptor protein
VRHDYGNVSLTSITSYQHASGYSRGETDGGAAVNFPSTGRPTAMASRRAVCAG